MTVAALAVELEPIEPDSAVPNPRPGPSLTLAMVDTYQRAWCRNRPACLRAVAGAPSLDCRGCGAFEPLTGEELRHETDGLCQLARVLERLRAEPDVRIPMPRVRRRRVALEATERPADVLEAEPDGADADAPGEPGEAG